MIFWFIYIIVFVVNRIGFFFIFVDVWDMFDFIVLIFFWRFIILFLSFLKSLFEGEFVDVIWIFLDLFVCNGFKWDLVFSILWFDFINVFNFIVCWIVLLRFNGFVCFICNFILEFIRVFMNCFFVKVFLIFFGVVG